MTDTRTEPADPTVRTVDRPDGAQPLDLLAQARQVYRDVVADPKTFGPAAGAIVRLSRAADQPDALVLALRAQAWVERANFGNEQAKILLDDAARIARRHGFDEGLSEVLVTRAAVNHELGRLGPAQRDLDLAGRLQHSHGSAELAFQQAVLYQNLGRLSQAAELYRGILADRTASAVVRTKTANNYSIVASQLGNPDEARRLVDVGSMLAAEAGPHLTAVLSSTRAWITTQTGRLTQGLVEFAEAARLHTVAGLPLAEHYLEYVDALTDLRLLPEAYEVAVQAADEFDRHGVQLMAGEGLLRVARLAALLGADTAATAAAEHARQRFDAQRRIPWRARADVVISDIAHRSGTASLTTLATIRRAAATLDRLGLASYSIDAHLSAGRIALALDRRDTALDNLNRATELARSAPVLLRLKGHLAGALATADPDRSRLRHCRTGLNDLAQHREAFASLELRVRASGHGAELGQLGLEVLLRHGSPAQVLAWMERTRAAALVAIEPAGDFGIDDELAALRVVQAELLAAQQGSEEVTALLARQKGIETRIRRRTWSNAGRLPRTSRRTSTAELRSALDGQVLVEYGVHDGRAFAVVVDQRRTRLVQLGQLSDVHYQVDAVLFGLRRLSRPARSPGAIAASRTSVDHALLLLRQQLLTPLKLPPETPVVVSPSGELRRVPWSALHTGPVAVIPAASFWQRTQQPRERTGNVLLVAGPDLPGASAEVAQLRVLHDSPVVLLPPDSTIDAVLSRLASADLVHLACHGRLRADNPAFSALQLHDGLLTLHEMEIRGVAPHRMVLAACDSAVDAVYEGNEVLGFVGALMARGTNALVASIVVVPDAASVPLMRGLHERVRSGDSFAAALFRARAGLDQDDPHEFVNWCAFNAYGAA